MRFRWPDRGEPVLGFCARQILQTLCLIGFVLAFGLQILNAQELKPIPMIGMYQSLDVNNGVLYMSDAERESCRLTVRDGLFYTPTGALADTIVHKMFVVDVSGRVYSTAALDRNRTEGISVKLQHSSFLSGGMVLAAGMIGFENGRLVFIDNNSGHYKPGGLSIIELLRRFAMNGVDISRVTYQFAETGETITPRDADHISQTGANAERSTTIQSCSILERIFGWMQR